MPPILWVKSTGGTRLPDDLTFLPVNVLDFALVSSQAGFGERVPGDDQRFVSTDGVEGFLPSWEGLRENVVL